MKEKKIYCPKCRRLLRKCDKKAEINIVCKCKYCNKVVIYYPENKEAKFAPSPERETSSGMVFFE